MNAITNNAEETRFILYELAAGQNGATLVK